MIWIIAGLYVIIFLYEKKTDKHARQLTCKNYELNSRELCDLPFLEKVFCNGNKSRLKMANTMFPEGITGLNCRNEKSFFIMATKSRVL